VTAARLDMADMDLGIAINDLAAPITAPDLEGVFEQLRDEVTLRSALDAAEADYQRALVLQRAGDIDECVPLLQAAAREPAVRFAAASLLGRIFKQGGLTSDAIEWFEQAADASAPEPSAAHEVLYELADALESAGEPARALAVWLELQADAGSYRDVAARIDRLANMKARG
jgi:tetratricopeptide (TPR) repeat protein